MPNAIDEITLNFSNSNIHLLNILLGLVMFGVALEIRLEHFKKVLLKPNLPVLGLVSQFIVLPAITFVLAYFLHPPPSVALGMILVAACPGGNISNFISAQAKANIALSVVLTAFSTLLAIFLTPINFSFWGNLLPDAKHILNDIELNPFEMFRTVLIIIAIPVVLGLFVVHYFPKIAKKMLKPFKIGSLVIFAGFVVIAFANNFTIFIDNIWLIISIVFIHNLVAFFSGYSIASIGRLSLKNKKSITIETGIQNSGLGLLLIFKFFDGLGGMSIIAAWWGIWHIVSGLVLAYFWNKY